VGQLDIPVGVSAAIGERDYMIDVKVQRIDVTAADPAHPVVTLENEKRMHVLHGDGSATPTHAERSVHRHSKL
jgi:hypothetical protein